MTASLSLTLPEAESEPRTAGSPAPESLAKRPPASDDGWLVGNRYQVLGRVAHGGMAEVFRAYDTVLRRNVAVKMCRGTSARPDVARRCAAEMFTHAGLNHPNLVTAYDAGWDTRDPDHRASYLVTELVDGPTVGQRISAGAMDLSEVAELGTQICDALAYVHAHGVVHRDVKPANILLAASETSESRPWTAKLTDFGIARQVDASSMTMTGITLGTLTYLSPEQARGAPVGPASDVYSLGLVLIEARTGVPAFAGSGLAVAMARLEHAPAMPASLEPSWVALLSAMVMAEPNDRPTAADVADKLRAISAGQADATGPLARLLDTGPSTTAPVGRRRARPVADEKAATDRHRRRAAACLGALLAAAALTGLVLMNLSRPQRAPTAPAEPANVVSAESSSARVAPAAAPAARSRRAQTPSRQPTTSRARVSSAPVVAAPARSAVPVVATVPQLPESKPQKKPNGHGHGKHG